VKNGRAVQQRCAAAGIPVSAEMGGNDPAIVLADCDLDRTAAGITHWALHNVGQSCGAVEVALVDSGVANLFVDRMRRTWEKLRVGPGAYGEVEVSPLANERQLQVVQRHVHDAQQKGATLVCGGRATGEGYFYEPTILDGCTEEMDVVREETFGPVLAIVRTSGANESIDIANRAAYGLTASIWTADLERAERLAERLDYGVVTINNHSLTGAMPGLPWSGTRATGFSVANSELSLATFTRPRAVLIDRNESPEPFWMPFDRDLIELGNALCDAQVGRVTRAWKLPLLLKRRVDRIRSFFRDA
jgi:acyl-CoA reductase-like NAD-dependent aldehyde dehydrogenase